MERKIRQAWRFWAFAVLLAAGCENMLRPQGLPKDPLLVGHRPVEGKAVSAVPATIVAVAPMPPPVPFEIASRPAFAQRKMSDLPDRVLFSGQRDLGADVGRSIRPPRPVPGILTNRPFPKELTLPDPIER